MPKPIATNKEICYGSAQLRDGKRNDNYAPPSAALIRYRARIASKNSEWLSIGDQEGSLPGEPILECRDIAKKNA